MTDDLAPWEPPFAGTEAEHLAAALDRLRFTFRWKADGLDAAGLRARLPTSGLSLAGLLKHLAWVEDYVFVTKLHGEELGSPWDEAGASGDPDWEFRTALEDEPEYLYRLWDDAVARSRATFARALADGGLDQPSSRRGPDGTAVSLRRIVFDLVEEYGRHTGQADLLREAVDGRVGEDPPDDWRP